MAVIQGPVYRSASAVNSTPLKNQQQHNQQLASEPTAEERESTSFQTAESVAKPTAVGASSTSNVGTSSSPTPATYTVHYYSNTHPGQAVYAANPVASTYQQPAANYQQAGSTYQQPATGYQQPAPAYQQTGTAATTYSQPQVVDAWTKYKVTEILVGVAAAGLVVAGGTLLYPKLINVRARALRELSELKTDDISRMTKGVMRALEKYYEMNSKKAD